MRLVFLGPPGSGKGTQAKLLQLRLAVQAIGMGDILRDAARRKTPLGLKVERYLTAGLLAPDDLVNEMIAERFRRPDHPTRFVLDGYPRTLAQAVWLESLLHDYGLDLRCAVHFVVPDEEVARRLGGRRIVQGRADDGEETVRKRLAVYHASARELIDHFRAAGLLRDVDATGDVETVYRSIVGLCGLQAV